MSAPSFAVAVERSPAPPPPIAVARETTRPLSTHRVILVSNRLPITLTDGAERAEIRNSNGGLVTGLRGLHDRLDSLWLGWAGPSSGAALESDPDLRRSLASRRIVPLPLDRSADGPADRDAANTVLWPVLHGRLERVPDGQADWETYEALNERFAGLVESEYRCGDLVWIHDYHLFRLPALLRARLPDARIGFFLHVPFPGPDVFSAIPVRRTLLHGVAGADLVGFHTSHYLENFVATAERCLGARYDGHEGGGLLRVGDRSVRLGVFPMGIDADSISARASARAITIATLGLRNAPCRRLLGVDRLDYSKGIVPRLLAFKHLLGSRPEWRGRVQLLQVCVPSREDVAAYRRHRREVESLVARINGLYATPHWLPIQYLYRSIPEELLFALYRAADVMLVTPLRDGMNLVAKEFAASRVDGDGVLLLSQFAGAAEALSQAILIDPHDVPAVANAIHVALTMPRGERRLRMQALRSRVRAHDVYEWGRDFLDTLSLPRACHD
jgi:trehalose 6-phosphate synthase/phosphatase